MEVSATLALSLQELRNTTELLERQGIAGGQLTPDDCDARRPGSEAWPEDTPSAWLQYALWLAERTARRGGAGERSLETVMYEALADEPVAVPLASGDVVHVHAKSLNALLLLEGLDAANVRLLETLRWLAPAVAAGEVEAGESTLFLAAVLKGRSIQFFAWIITHAGPGLPFADTDAAPEPPDWTRALRAEDLEALVRAHLQVNRRDLDFLAAAFPADAAAGKARLPLSGFLGAQAGEEGVAPRVLICDRSLRATFAQAIARAELSRAARAAPRGREP